MTAFRATFVIDDPAGCPAATASAMAAAPVTSVTRSSPSSPDAPIVEEFTVESDPDGEPAALETDDRFSPLYADENRQAYRFTRDREASCVCDVVEDSGNPVTSITAVDGALRVCVRAAEVEELTEIVTALRSDFADVSLEDLVQLSEANDADLVLVDRARLTDRQRLVLETAHEMGYFGYPKGANAGEVAEAIDISRSTFAEHLAAAQGKLLDAILES